MAARFAHTFRDLGDWVQARYFATKATVMSATLPRTQAFNLTVLATAHVESDANEACSLGTEVLDRTLGLQSGRAVRYLSDLQRRLVQRHPTHPRTLELVEQTAGLFEGWSMIYHIAFESDWAKARREGEYRISTKGRTLEEQGLIHGGTADQVAPVANMIYGSDEGLVVLVIDEDKLSSPLQYDDVPDWDQPFPHIYGPLNPDAVISILTLNKGADGKFEFTPSSE